MENSKIRVKAQIDNGTIIKVYAILGRDARQIGALSVIPGTGYSDGVKICEGLEKLIEPVLNKRLKELEGGSSR